MFPSPCGEMGIRNDLAKKVATAALLLVSVPLRGNGYKEQKDAFALCLPKSPSFRPLAGKWV